MRPLLIGIAGGSGSGKTTIAQRVCASLADRDASFGGDDREPLTRVKDASRGARATEAEGRGSWDRDRNRDRDRDSDRNRDRDLDRDLEALGRVTIIEHDAYYRDRDDLTYEGRCQLNFDHPDSLETSLLVEHLRALRRGEAVDVPIYDFKNHRRSTEVRRTKAVDVIIVEGILVFVEEALRNELDVKIYVDTDADIRAFRRIRRDIEQRGRTFDSVRDQYYKTVRPMHLRFVEPSKRYADVIIPEGGDNRIGVELVAALVERIRAAKTP